jgi:NAD-dependent dihydropyrimidine dehydrogenase PreA subunit
MKATEGLETIPIINAKRCTACGICEDLCPTHAVEVQNKLAVIVRPDACTFCDICESYCPESAIERPFSISFAATVQDHTQPGPTGRS